MVWRDLAEGRLEAVMPGWSMPSIAAHLVTPPGGPRPARVTALLDFIAERFTRPAWSERARSGSSV